MKAVVIIPTYNEAETINEVLDRILKVSKQITRHDIEILVVDDSSPDGTAKLVERKAMTYLNVHLLLRESKDGLGAAYMHGFKYAINVMDADIVIEMDADLQHSPEDLPRLLEAIDKGATCVIGSRFSKGGSIPKEWAFYRKFLSRVGSIFARFILGIPGVNDYTSGFKATKVKNFMEKIPFGEISSNGFAYKLEIMFRLSRMGAKFEEIPIDFGLRDRGSSKMELSNLIDSFYLVLKLRALEMKSFLLFLVVGTIGFFVDTFIFNIFLLLSTVGALNIKSIPLSNGSIGSLISGFIAMFVTYMLNNRWTFGDRNVSEKTGTLGSILVYYIFSYIPIGVRSLLVNYASERYNDTILINNIAFFVGIFFGLIWNFTVYSKIIWRKNTQKAD